jgi:transcriptional regulator with XRE-family HTH domain
VPTRSTRAERGRANAIEIRRAIGKEVRLARVGAGASLRDVAAAADMSHTQFGRIERGLTIGVSVDQLSRACSAVGLRLIARAVPGAGPAVDEAQLKLLERFRAVLAPETPFWTEVPLPNPGDLRAWDAMISVERLRIAIEAETRLGDLQALDRRCRLKLRDGDVDRLILVVSDTANNREVLDVHRDALRPTFPLDGRAVLRALRAGRAPAANGILVR